MLFGAGAESTQFAGLAHRDLSLNYGRGPLVGGIFVPPGAPSIFRVHYSLGPPQQIFAANASFAADYAAEWDEL